MEPKEEEEENDLNQLKKKKKSEFIKRIRKPYGHGTYKFRRFYSDDEGGDSPISMQFCPDFFINKLKDTERKRSTFNFFYTHRHVHHENYEEGVDSLYHEEMQLEGTIFRDIRESIMFSLGIDFSDPECRVCETRLWLMFLNSPFIVISSLEFELVSNFESRIRCSIDGFTFLLECRYLGEKYVLDKLIDCRSSWKFTDMCLEDPRFVDWMSMKRERRKKVVLEDTREIKERIKFVVLESLKDKSRILEIKCVSVKVKLVIPKLILVL